MSPVSWLLEQRALKRPLRDTDIYHKRLSSRLNDLKRYQVDGRQDEFDRANAEAEAILATEPQENDYMPTKNVLLFWNAVFVVAIVAFVIWLL